MPGGLALKHAFVWMLSGFGYFSCWFGLRSAWNCRHPLVDQATASSFVSKCGKKLSDSMDIFGSFCTTVLVLASLFLTCLLASRCYKHCRLLSPVSLFTEFWNLVFRLSMPS